MSVQKVVKTRNLIQVRSHAQKVFMKMTKEEIEVLIGKDSEFESSRSQRSEISEDDVSESQNNFVPTLVKQSHNSLLDLFRQAIEQEGINISQETDSFESKNFSPEKSICSVEDEKVEK